MLTLLATLALATPALAQSKPGAEGKNPPLSDTRAFPNLTLIYRFTGLHDSGGAPLTGTAAYVTCTNWGPPATLRTVLRRLPNTIIGSVTANIATGETLAAATKQTAFMDNEIGLGINGTYIDQGSLLVYSTSPQVQCGAFNVDATSFTPAYWVPLPAQRQNPPTGVTE